MKGFEQEDPEMVTRGLNSSFIRDLDVEFALMAKHDIPLPDTCEDLEKAAALFGAQRVAALEAEQRNRGGEYEHAPHCRKNRRGYDTESENGLC